MTDEEHQFVDKRLFTDNNPAQNTTLPIHIFCCRMDNQVKSILNGFLEIRCGKTIVDRKDNMGIFLFELTQPFQVHQFQTGVRGRF